jgi:hypothetical protein
VIGTFTVSCLTTVFCYNNSAPYIGVDDCTAEIHAIRINVTDVNLDTGGGYKPNNGANFPPNGKNFAIATLHIDETATASTPGVPELDGSSAASAAECVAAISLILASRRRKIASERR